MPTPVRDEKSTETARFQFRSNRSSVIRLAADPFLSASAPHALPLVPRRASSALPYTHRRPPWSRASSAILSKLASIFEGRERSAVSATERLTSSSSSICSRS